MLLSNDDNHQHLNSILITHTLLDLFMDLPDPFCHVPFSNVSEDLSIWEILGLNMQLPFVKNLCDFVLQVIVQCCLLEV